MNKIILITGASSGIGEGCARKFASEGAKLILNSRSADKLEALAQELKEKYGTACYVLPFDVRNRKAAADALASLPEEWKAMIKDSAILLIYTGYDIKRITKEDLIRNQSSISLSFSTENLDIEERISAFCLLLNYFKDLHFDFDSFNLSENAESIVNMYKINEGVQNNNNTEEDI